MISLLIDHLLESTAFAILMALLTLCFANNRASVRYGLWFAASVKFLVPFSLIAAAGSALRWDSAPAVTLDLPRFTAAMPDLPVPAISAAIADAPLAPQAMMPLAVAHRASGVSIESMLLAIWVLGSAFLLCRWTVQWLRLSAVRKASTPAPIKAAIPVRLSSSLYEPGLVGILHPVLLLPEAITAQLSPRQLALVIEHELCHWRRRDNVTAAIHMAAALVFWFHPLIWWIGRHLVAERERACDESVLAACSDPKSYADSILEVCRFYVRSPLACAPGVAGANLTHRVERIMNNVASIDLSRTKSVLLTSLAAGALLLPMASGLLTPSAVAALTQPDVVVLPKTPQAREAVAPQKPAQAQTIVKKAPSTALVILRASMSKRDLAKIAEPALMPQSERQPAEQSVAASAPAEAPAVSPPAAPMEEIVVTGKKIREFVRTRNFVRTYTAPSEFLDQISRWHAPLCVNTVGLAKGYNAFVTARIKEVAAQIGAPKVQAEPCKTNLDIIFNAHPQAVLDYIRTKRPELLGPHYPAMRRKLATVSHPVQAWYATGTRDSRGRWTIDTYDGWGGTVPGVDEFEAPVYIVPGSHLITGLSSEFASVVVVADAAKVADWEIGTVADYIAMMALARTSTLDKCQQVPSITNALADCASGVKAKALSPYDMAYLKALYTTSSDQPRGLQEAGISSAMLKILEKQVSEK